MKNPRRKEAQREAMRELGDALKRADGRDVLKILVGDLVDAFGVKRVSDMQKRALS